MRRGFRGWVTAGLVAVTAACSIGLPSSTDALVGSRRSLFAGGARNSLFGVNLSGAEFAPWNGQRWPSAANFAYLASKGVSFVRLPIAWESIQTSLNGSLDATYLSGLTTALANASANGIKCIVDLHNYGLYTAQAQWTTTVPYAGNGGVYPATGVSILGNGVSSANFADVWTKLSTALKGNPGLLGYGLMNEPQAAIVGPQLAKSTNYFALSGPPIGVNWFAINSGTATQLANGTNPLGATYSAAWQIDATQSGGFSGVAQQFTFLAATQYTFSIYVKVASGTQPFLLQLNANDGGHTATTSWQRFSFTATPGALTGNIGIIGNGATQPLQIADAQLEVAASPTAYNPSTYFSFAQAGISAIRAVDAVAPIYVNGQNFGAASSWFGYNNDNVAFTGGGIVHEAHTYFDGPQGIGNGGVYSGTFTSYSINTQTGVQTNALWLAWLSQYGVKGYLGEFGIPNSAADNNVQWFPTMTNTLRALQAQRVMGTQWFFGSAGIQPANALNVAPVSGVDDPRLMQMLAIR